ncbi:MAG: ABC transporter ATP-binding protein [Myxococcales bacterium]|nr:ABC transporter ATP-binding protein [Myxococcales bacterium]
MNAVTEAANRSASVGDLIVKLEQVVKEYALGKVTVPAVRGVDLEIRKGEFITVAGPSGSGKTTLLNLIGCVDTATRGTVLVDGKDTGKLSERELTKLRLFTIGFIFQSFNLVSVLTAFQNVEFPLLLQKSIGKADRTKRVLDLLEAVGLKEHADHRPGELSGGQRQRVAVARALVTKPKLVLADEPTANLDSATGKSIIDLMKELNETQGTTFVFSTHDHEVMRRAGRVVQLVDGRVVSAGDESAKTSAGGGAPENDSADDDKRAEDGAD